MLDFKELPQNGNAFEQMVREILFSKGLETYWSGVGPDGGKDIIVHEKTHGLFSSQTKKWLVQCKHNAHGGGSVSIDNLDDVVDSCIQHDATGYLLVCSTQPSASVISRLEGITKNVRNDITATYWDSVMLEKMISNPTQWAIAQLFFPVSAGDWKVYATASPNQFIAHYNGYVFQLTNRIGSGASWHLEYIKGYIDKIELIELPEYHMLRPRAVWYDDKSGNYTVYLDYLYPSNVSTDFPTREIASGLDNVPMSEMVHWDIQKVEYFPYSDHFDQDHFEYYTKYLPNYLTGTRREGSEYDYWVTKQELDSLNTDSQKVHNSAFNSMIGSFEGLDFLRIVRSVNAKLENVHKFERKRNWLDVMEDINFDVENLFKASIVFNVNDEDKFHELISVFPQGPDGYFRLGKVSIYTPSGLNNVEGEEIYDLDISIHPAHIENQFVARKNLNIYFDQITNSIKKFKNV